MFIEFLLSDVFIVFLHIGNEISSNYNYSLYSIQGSADEEAVEEAAGLEEALPTRRKVEVPSNQRLFASSTRRGCLATRSACSASSRFRIGDLETLCLE